MKGVPLVVNGKTVAPTLETVKSNEYPVSRSLYMLTVGEPTGLAKDYIDFILSDEGQAIVEEEGFVRID